jgi:adenylate cyclase
MTGSRRLVSRHGPRIFQWLWDRYGTRYSWALGALMYLIALVAYLVWSMTIVAFERSSHYGEAARFTVFAAAVRTYMLLLSGRNGVRAVEQWAAGSEVYQREVLTATYIYSRRTVGRGVASDTLWTALFMIGVGAIAGATGSRLVQRNPGCRGRSVHDADLHARLHGRGFPARPGRHRR